MKKLRCIVSAFIYFIGIDCVFVNASTPQNNPNNQNNPKKFARSNSANGKRITSTGRASSLVIPPFKKSNPIPSGHNAEPVNQPKKLPTKALKPTPKGLDLSKINDSFGVVDGQPGVRYNKSIMTAPIDDYVVALKQNKDFQNVAQQIPEIFPTYTLEYLENPSTHDKISNFYRTPTPKVVSEQNYKSWYDPQKESLYKRNLNQGLRFLNDNLKSPDFKFYTSSPLMVDSFENYIIALRKEYPLVPDKVLAVYVKKFFEKQPRNAVLKDGKLLTEGQSFDADDLIANTKDNLLIRYDSDGVFDGSGMTDLQKSYITMRTIQKVNEKYKGFMSDTPVDSLSFSDNNNPSPVQSNRGGGLQMVPAQQTSVNSQGFVDAPTPDQSTSKGSLSTSPSVPRLKRTASFSAFSSPSSPPKLTRAPSTKNPVPLPAKKLLLDSPSANDIKSLIIDSNQMGEVANFETNLGVTAFSANASYLSSNKNQYITNLIKNYSKVEPGGGLFGPVIKLRQDINALRDDLHKITSKPYTQNLTTAISIAEEALEQMTDNITATKLFDELSKSEGNSVYYAAKKVSRSIADLEAAKGALLSSEVKLFDNDPIIQKYRKMYTDVEADLIQVRKAVLELEGDRSSIFQLNEASQQADQRLSAVSFAPPLKLTVLKQDEFNQRVKKQIDLDIEALQEVDIKRDLVENTKIEKLFPAGLGRKNNIQLITDVLDDLIQELDAEKSVYAAKVKRIKTEVLAKRSDDVDMNSIADKIEAIVKRESSETPDFLEFLKKTERLQVHANVLKKLSSTIQSQNQQYQAKDFIDTTSQSYVKQILRTNSDVAANIAAIERKLLAIDSPDFNLSQEVAAIKKEVGSYPSTNPTQQEIKNIYTQVLNRLKVKGENEIVFATIRKEAKDNAIKLMDIYKNDSDQDPIVRTLTELMKQSKDTRLKTLLETYKNSGKNIDDVKEVQVKLRKLAGTEIDLLDENNTIYSPQKSPIISYSNLIDDLYNSMETYKNNQDLITTNFNSLKKKLVIDSSSFFTKDLITKKKIDDAIEALKYIKDTDTKNLAKVIKEFNEGLSGYEISEKTSKDVFEGTLKKLQAESTLLVEKNLLYQGLNSVYAHTLKPIVNFFASSGAVKSSQVSLSAADQAATSAATQNFFDVTARPGATAAEVEGALHNVVRTVSSTNNILGTVFAAAIGSPAILLIIKVAAPMFQKIQSSNLSQEQKDNLTRELLDSTFQDIINEVIAEKTGADLATIQSGDTQTMGMSALLNYGINALDPNVKNSYQYNSAPKGNSTANINKWKADTLAHAPATTQQNYYGSNYSGASSYPYSSSSSYYPSSASSYSYPSIKPALKPIKSYPSLDDLAQMENESELSAYTSPATAVGYAPKSLPELSTPSTSVPFLNRSSYPSRVTSSPLPYTLQANLLGAPIENYSPSSTGSYQDVLAQIRENSQSQVDNHTSFAFGG